jgi:GTP-binding protein Era
LFVLPSGGLIIDTPGMQKPKNRLGNFMRDAAESAIQGVEAVMAVLDLQAGLGAGDHEILKWAEAGEAPVIAVCNKIDAVTPERASGQMALLDQYPRITRRIAVSAMTGQGLDTLTDTLKSLMPEGPKYFPDDMYTDQPERVITAEIIREKALRALSQEVTHGIGVEIMRIAPRKDKQMLEIQATIYCERSSHKGIVIGKNGAMLKRIGSESRSDIEELFGEKVFLELWVKVREDWRNSPTALRELGYTKE